MRLDFLLLTATSGFWFEPFSAEDLARHVLEATHVLVKTGGLLGVEDVNTQAPKVYRRLWMAFEERRDHFHLEQTYPLPDDTLLEVWVKKR